MDRISQKGQEVGDSFRDLEGVDPFADVSASAEGAVDPITNVGTATNEMVGEVVAADPELQTLVTSFEDAGSAATDTATKTESFGSSLTAMTGAVASIGGTIGTLISTMFRLRDAQIQVQTAQARAASASEAYRKSEDAINKTLSTATSNTAAIAAARDRLSAAMAKLNQMQNEGVTSGQAYEAAVAEVNAAQQQLAQAAQGTGVDVAKLTGQMEANQNASLKSATATDRVAKALENQKKTVLDSVFGFTSFAGSIVQTIQGMSKMGPALKTAAAGFKDVAFWIGRGGIIGGLTSMIPILAAVTAGVIIAETAYEGFRAIPKIFSLINAAIEGNVQVAINAAIQLMEIMKHINQIKPTAFIENKILDDAIKKLKEVAKAREVDIDVTEQQKSATTGWEHALAALPPEIKKVLNEMIGFEAIPPATNEVAASVTEVGSAASEASGPIKDIGTELIATRAKMTAARDEFRTFLFDLQDAPGTISAFGKELATFGSGFQVIDGVVKQGSKTIDTSTGALQRQQANLQSIVPIANEFTNATGAWDPALKAANDEIERQSAAVGALQGETSKQTQEYLEAKNAGDEWANSLHLQITELESIITAMEDVNNQQKLTTLALLENHKAYLESAQRIKDLNAIMSDSTAHFEAVQTAVNEETASLMENRIALEAAATVASDAAIQNEKVSQAYLEGATSAAEWRNELEQSKAAQQGQIDSLAKMGINFTKLKGASDGTLPPTIENLKLLGAAFNGTAEDAQAWLDALSEAFAKVQEAGNEMVNNLSDALVKGGEDQDEIIDKWLEDMPEMVRERLSESQLEMLQGMGELQAIAKANKLVLEAGLKAGDMGLARKQFIDGIKEMRSEAKPQYKGIYDMAIDIAEKGTADQMHRVAEILASDDPWPVMLERLKQIKLEQEGARLGKDFTMSFNQALQSGFADQSRFMGGARFQELLKTQPGQAAKVDVDTTAAHQKLTAFHSALTAITQITVAPKIDVDATAAHGKLSALHSALTAITGITVAPKIDVEASSAHSKLTALHQALTAITKIKVAPIITANSAPAVAAANRATAAFNRAGAAGTAMGSKVKAAGSAIGSAMSSAASKAASAASRIASSFSRVGSAASSATSKVKSLASAINSLKSKSITIHVGISGPGVRYLQHGFHGVVSKPMLFVAGEAGPERVDVTPGVSALGKTSETIHKNVVVGATGGGTREINLNVPVFLDGKVITRVVRRHLAEDVTAGM